MIRTTRVTRFAAIAGAAALTATSLFLAPVGASATTTSDDSTSGECHLGQRLVAAWDKLPEELRADLKALRDLPQGERRDAARDIREGALDGEYGDGVQDHAQRIRDRRVAIWATMDEALKTDLKAIHDADAADRPALVDELAQHALDGVYGERAQQVAERLQEHCG